MGDLLGHGAASLANVGSFVGPLWAMFGQRWVICWAMLGHVWAMLGYLLGHVGPWLGYWLGHVGPCLGEVGLFVGASSPR